MHEFSIAISLLEQCHSILQQEQATRISVIRLSIGRLSGVEPELLRRALEQLNENTPATGAKIEIRIEDSQLECQNCEHLATNPELALYCPRCGSGRVQVVGGKSMQLIGLDIF